MTMQTETFKSALHSALAATPVADLLALMPALILERVARGGGATKWHYCPSKSSLGAVRLDFCQAVL